MYDVAIDLIYNYLETDLSLNHLTGRRLEERSYIRWALSEILPILYENSDLFFIPEYISKKQRKNVFEIFDDFIDKMEYLLDISYNWGFDVAKQAAIQFKVYLKNTKLFKDEV